MSKQIKGVGKFNRLKVLRFICDHRLSPFPSERKELKLPYFILKGTINKLANEI